MSDEPLYELAYREAVRAVERQHSTVSELRNRSGILIATAAISVSLLSERAFAGGAAPLAWVAITAFVLVCGCAIVVAWPRTELVVALDLLTLVRDLTSAAMTNRSPLPSHLYRDFTIDLASRQRLNARHITATSRAFRVGSLVLAIQLAATVATRFLTT